MNIAQLGGVNFCVLDCYTEGVKHRRTDRSAVYEFFSKTLNILTLPQPHPNTFVLLLLTTHSQHKYRICKKKDEQEPALFGE
jgi:hypothetical protein